MYKSVCNDIFGGTRDKTVERIKLARMNTVAEESAISAILICSDLSWILVALAKAWQGEDLIKIIKEKWDSITTSIDTEKELFNFDNDASSKLYYQMVIESTIDFITKSISQFTIDKENTIYHPYAYVDYITIALRFAYDNIMMLPESDKAFDDIYEFVEGIVFDNLPLAGKQHELIQKYTLKLAIKTDGISDTMTYENMYRDSYSLKAFRNKLAFLVNYDIISKSLYGLDSNIESKLTDLINLAKKSGIDIMPIEYKNKQDGKGYTHPSDIDELFD